jgi:hypothetical protein
VKETGGSYRPPKGDDYRKDDYCTVTSNSSKQVLNTKKPLCNKANYLYGGIPAYAQIINLMNGRVLQIRILRMCFQALHNM